MGGPPVGLGGPGNLAALNKKAGGESSFFFFFFLNLLFLITFFLNKYFCCLVLFQRVFFKRGFLTSDDVCLDGCMFWDDLFG